MPKLGMMWCQQQRYWLLAGDNIGDGGTYNCCTGGMKRFYWIACGCRGAESSHLSGILSIWLGLWETIVCMFKLLKGLIQI